MRKGDKVRVYQKPLTSEDFEGVAALVEQVRPDDGDGLSIWLVQFEGEEEYYQRCIYKEALMRDYDIKLVGTVRDFESWYLVQFDFDSVVEYLGVGVEVQAEGWRGCLIDNEALDHADYTLKDVVWFPGVVPGLDKSVYKLVII